MKKNSLFTNVSADLLRKRKKTTQPSFIKPMLATLTTDYFSKKDWIYEHKFDGERCLAFKKRGIVQLRTRNNKSLNGTYPELVTALAAQKADNFIIDGEIIAITKGISDFELLQGRINLQRSSEIEKRSKKIKISYCIFDLIYVDGYDIQNLPLWARKDILKKLLKYTALLSFTKHKIGDGIAFFKQACKRHWEGVIAKQRESTYVGKRSTNWLKFKCIMKQELVIGGYTQPKGSRTDLGALLVGYYEKGKLIYAGKVGTGYSEETLKILGKLLRPLRILQCPFTQYDKSIKDVFWVKPKLVAEFEFAQWTDAGKLRVGRYKGLRDDKDAQDVVKEIPKSIIPH